MDSEAKQRSRVAAVFFPNGIPPEVVQGWEALDLRRQARIESGKPLPTGGTFIFNEAAVLAACLAEVHGLIARLLVIDASRVHMRISRADGVAVPVADIQWPDATAEDQKSMKGAIAGGVDHFWRIFSERMRSIHTRNVALDQPIAPADDRP